MARASERLLVISPARDEAERIDRLAASVAAQTRQPDRWIIVDDGSGDATAERARRWSERLPYLEVITLPDGGGEAVDARLADAKEAVAFNAALATVDLRAFDFVGKLDADIELPAHWFAALLAELSGDPGLGIAGGELAEPRGSRWRRVRIPGYHVHGAVKLYRRECLEAIGGIRELLGWDTIDETYARMRGFKTRTSPALVARHLRPCGDAGGRLRGRARYGRCAYAARYGPAWVAARSLKVATTPPYLLSGVAFMAGYARAALTRAPRVEDAAFMRFTRAELRGRLGS